MLTSPEGRNAAHPASMATIETQLAEQITLRKQARKAAREALAAGALRTAVFQQRLAHKADAEIARLKLARFEAHRDEEIVEMASTAGWQPPATQPPTGWDRIEGGEETPVNGHRKPNLQIDLG